MRYTFPLVWFDNFKELKMNILIHGLKEWGGTNYTPSDMGVLLYTDFDFVSNNKFMQYKLNS